MPARGVDGQLALLSVLKRQPLARRRSLNRLAKGAIGIAFAMTVTNVLGATAKPGERLHGSYTVSLTVPELVHAGAARTVALGDAGTWNLTVAATTWSLRQNRGMFGNTLDRGTLTQQRARLMLTLVTSNSKPHHEYLGAVSVQDSGVVLRLAAIKPVSSEVVRVLAARPWNRLG